MVNFLLDSAVNTTANAASANEHIITQALDITLIGMGILFVSLLILWGVMEILVRVVKDPKEKESPEEETEASAPIIELDEQELKTRAAVAAAVSIKDFSLKMRAAAAAAGYAAAKK